MALNIPIGSMTAEELEELEKQKQLQLTAAGVNKPGTESTSMPTLNLQTMQDSIENRGPITVTRTQVDQPTTNKYNDYFKQNAEFDDAFAQIDALNDLEYGKQPVDYNAYFAQKNEQNKEILKENLRLASMSDSDRTAEIQRLSEESGLPPSLIEGNVEEVKRMITLLSLDAERLAIDSPVLAAQLQDPTFAAIAYDDIETLGQMEQIFHNIVAPFRALSSGVPAVSGGAYHYIGMIPGSIDALMDAVGIDTEFDYEAEGLWMFKNLLNVPQALSEGFQSIARGQLEMSDEWLGDISMYSPSTQALLQGPRSVGMLTPGMVGFFMTGQPAFLYVSMGVAEGGAAFEEALKQDLPYHESVMYSITQGTTEMAFERLPAMRWLKDMKIGSSFFKQFYNQLLIEIPQEQMTSIVQDYNSFMILPEQQDETFGDYLRARPESAWHTFLATVSGVGTQTSVMYGTNQILNKYTDAGIKVDPELRRYIEDNLRADEAKIAQSKIEGLADLIKNSKMMENAPEQLKGFINELFQSQVEGQENPQVVIYAQDLIQYAQEQGIDVRDISPLIAEQLDETIANAGFFSFSIEDYLMEIATGEHAEGVNLLLRINENAMSVNEANSWSEEANQKLIEQAEALYASMGNKDVESADAVFEEVVNQLVGIGVPRDEANQSATLYKAFFAVMADRAGMDAKELFDKYGLNVQRNLPETAALAYAAQTQSLGELINEVLKPTVKAETVKKDEVVKTTELDPEKKAEVLERMEKLMEGRRAPLFETGTNEGDQVIIDNYGLEYLYLYYEEMYRILGENLQNDESLSEEVKQERIKALPELLENKNKDLEEQFGTVEIAEEVVDEVVEQEVVPLSKLKTMKKADLVELATSLNVQIEGKVTKAILIDSINNAQIEAEVISNLETQEDEEVIATPEQILSLRNYLEAEMGIDLEVASQEEIVDALQKAVYDPQGRILDQAAWHGTGLSEIIEEFSTDFIGTGEGFQGYGWGLYFTSQRGIAEWYRSQNSINASSVEFIDANGNRVEGDEYSAVLAKELEEPKELGLLILDMRDELGEVEMQIQYMEEEGLSPLSVAELNKQRELLEAENEDNPVFDNKGSPQDVVEFEENLEEIEEILEQVRNKVIHQSLVDQLPEQRKQLAIYEKVNKTEGYEIRSKGGATYLVELAPEKEDYLLWDVEIGLQSEKVQKVIKKLKKKHNIGVAGGLDFGRDVYYQIGSAVDFSDQHGPGVDEKASKYLLEQGIRGIQFETGSTRNKEEKEYNWVIFDDKDVTITKTYNQTAKDVAKYTDERLEGLLRDDAIIRVSKQLSKYHTTSAIATINPADFIQATSRGREDMPIVKQIRPGVYTDELISEGDLVQREVDFGLPLDTKRLREDSETPYLEVAEFDGEFVISAHEGRHRMGAMARAGITEAPVLIRFVDDVRSPNEGVLSGQWVYEEYTDSGLWSFGEDFKPKISYSNLVDIKQENEEELKKVHGSRFIGGAKVFFQDRKEPTIEELIAQKQQGVFLEDEAWRNWRPKYKNGKPVGSPEWVKNSKHLTKLRNDLGKLLQEGKSGRYWYEKSARGVMRSVNNDIVEAEKFIQLLAIYSAHTEVFVNTMGAVKAYTMWKNGVSEDEFHVATGEQDKKAINLLYHNKAWKGRKTSTFYQNLMYEIVRTNPGALDQLSLEEDLVNTINKGATIDLWMYRAFGYRQEAGGDDKGLGKYSFAENETRRLTARLNQDLKEGEDRWTPHQVQAAIWAAMRTRYNFPEVKAETTRISINKKLAKVVKKDGKKKLVFPTKGKEKDQHYRIWRKEAMKVPSEAVIKEASANDASFAAQLTKMTKHVTWEANPSTSLNEDISNASFELQRRFTEEAKKIILDDNGNDLLALLLNIPLNWDSVSRGAYEGIISPNVITRLIPIKPAGDFTREDVRTYAQAIQYIYKQDAVPWFRPDPQALSSQAAKKANMFRVYKISTGRTIQGGVVETLAEAKKLVKDKGKGFDIKGGRFSRGVTIKFKNNLTTSQLEKAIKLTGIGDWTQTATDEITIINFRNDETGIPIKVDDEVFLDNILETFDKHGKKLKVDRLFDIYTEGEYGNVHNWQSNKTGQKLLNRGSLGRSPDLHSGLRSWRKEFEKLLEDYSGENLKLREEELKTYNQQKRGSIQFRSNETVISLFAGADRSTFLHESGHLFLQIMQDLGEDPNAPENIKKDWQTILNYLEVESGADIGVEQHEKWAESFEKYLFEGNPPSTELQGVFRRFKAWMISVYKQLKNLDVEINDEIRGIFDRMLATPEEIKEAENVSRFIPMFENMEQSGMTQAEWDNYQDTANAATRQAEDDLDRKKLSEIERERKKWYRAELEKVKVQVEEEVNKMPVYQAIHFLQTGEVLEGEALPGLEPMKLDKKALIDEFGQILGQLPKGRKIHTTKDGIHHDLVAELFGFKSGEEMIRSIIKAKPRKQFIEEIARERLMKAYGDMMRDRGKLEEEAIKSVHNTDQRSRFLQHELNALSKRANVPGTPAAAAREAAINIIERLNIQDIHPKRYRAAELAAARAAEKAMIKENWAEAAKNKRSQLLNHHLYRESEKRLEEVAKFLRYFDRLNKPATRKRLARDYIDQIYTLLESVDLKASVSKKARANRTSFAAWVAEQEEQGLEVVFSEEMLKLLQSSEKTHYKDMTFADFKQLYDTIRNIEHIARWKQKMLDDRAQMDFEETVEEMIEVAINEHKAWKVDTPDFTKSKLRQVMDNLKEFGAAHDKIEYVAQAMDGHETNGIWWKTIFRPIADAEHAEMEMQEVFINRLNAIMTKHYTAKERRAWDKKVSTPQGSFNKKNILSMALNWGNEENRIALLNGFETKKGWNFSGIEIENILDTHMEERDWQMVQEVWIMINELWPQIAALQKELTGIVPQKVEAAPFETKFGTMPGGYYPLSYDPEKSDKQRKRSADEQIQDLFENSAAKAATKKGHTIQRVGSGGQMVRLDLDVLSEHLHNVIHDLTHRKAVIQVNKILMNEDVQAAIQGVLGKKVYDAINPWLKAVAAPEPNYMGALERMLNWTRHSATIVAMGWKVTTAMVQPLGYTQSIAYLGEKWAMKGLKSFYANPYHNRNEIIKKSVFMRNRTKTLDRDVRDSVNRITGSDSRMKTIQSKYFFFIGFMDMSVSLPTWMAAYEKAIHDGLSEKEAIANGDSAVRMTQGSGSMKDLARIQQGDPMRKLFTMFYSYFSAYYNMSKRTIQLRKDGKISTFEAFRHFMWLTLLPAVLSELMLGRGPDDDEDESWARWTTETIGTYPFLGMVFFRDVANALTHPEFGTALPYTDFADAIINAGWATTDLFTEDEFNEVDIKNIMLGIAFAFKLPGRQAANIYEHLYEVLSEGEDLSMFELLVKRDRND